MKDDTGIGNKIGAFNHMLKGLKVTIVYAMSKICAGFHLSECIDASREKGSSNGFKKEIATKTPQKPPFESACYQFPRPFPPIASKHSRSRDLEEEEKTTFSSPLVHYGSFSLSLVQ